MKNCIISLLYSASEFWWMPWRLSINSRVLPASCRQRNVSEALPTRRRQHLVGGTVRLVRGSWSQGTAAKRWGLFHEPAGDKPTPDPSQEGNCPRRAAPLLGVAWVHCPKERGKNERRLESPAELPGLQALGRVPPTRRREFMRPISLVRRNCV